MEGHVFNPFKNVTGATGDFLQRCLYMLDGCKTATPKKPMAPLLMTLASGNWYRAQRDVPSGMLPALCSIGRDLVARGIPACLARRVVSFFLGLRMKISWVDEQNKVVIRKLE